MQEAVSDGFSSGAARNTRIIFPALIFVTILTTFVTAGELV